MFQIQMDRKVVTINGVQDYTTASGRVRIAEPVHSLSPSGCLLFLVDAMQ
jgi:hypothetical protein